MIQEKKLNFKWNYNGKLWLNYFTTIRSLDTLKEKDLKEGDDVLIQKDRVTLFRAMIVNIEEIDLNNLSKSQETLLMLDFGYRSASAARVAEHLCKSNKVALITLTKL